MMHVQKKHRNMILMWLESEIWLVLIMYTYICGVTTLLLISLECLTIC
jgi:hypothetical protein